MAPAAPQGRVLVTGSTGFLGRHLLDHLAARGYAAVCLIRPATDARVLVGRPVVRAAADYDDADSLDRALAGVRCVFHLGAVLDGRDERALFRANVEATQLLAAACLRSERPPRFVFASSISAAGPSSDGRRMRETDPCAPVTAYGRTKLLAERALAALRPQLPLVVLRFPNLLGEGQRQLGTTMSLVRRHIVPVPGSPRTRTSICFAPDAARALVLAAERSPCQGEVYYATDGGAYTWQDLVEPLVRELVSGPVLRLRAPVLAGIAALIQAWAGLRGSTPVLTVDDILSTRRYNWLYDDTLIRTRLGWAPRVAFAAEMPRLARAFREGRS